MEAQRHFLDGESTHAHGHNISLIDNSSVPEHVFGISSAWRDVLSRAARVAVTEATTCLEGESGTGKEVVARFIHSRSPRRRGPFVAINCAALPEQLLESELFGFERGAFTGAQQAKPGQIELASGGVLFLDEVTEMTLAAQAKFLRVLQEREFVRLGGTRPVRANLRVIAATNRDLHDAVAGGQFRADLYYRLNVFDIHIPPLRQRRADIPALVIGFLREFDHTAGRGLDITSEAMGALLHHDWPGNVRELRNVLERATILCEGELIRREDLALRPSSPAQGDSTDLEVLERRTIERVMRDADGNKVEASRKLGISRMQLYGRLRKYGLETRPVEAPTDDVRPNLPRPSTPVDPNPHGSAQSTLARPRGGHRGRALSRLGRRPRDPAGALQVRVKRQMRSRFQWIVGDGTLGDGDGLLDLPSEELEGAIRQADERESDRLRQWDIEVQLRRLPIQVIAHRNEAKEGMRLRK